MDDIRVRRATRGQPPLGPSQPSYNPLGSAIGCLAAGAWSLGFGIWLKPPTWFTWILICVGWLAIAVGLLLIGASIGNLLNRRRGHGY